MQTDIASSSEKKQQMTPPTEALALISLHATFDFLAGNFDFLFYFLA